MNKWVVPGLGFVIGLLVFFASLGGGATPLQAGLGVVVVLAYAVGLRLLQSRSETASLLSGMPRDERWESINNLALSLAAQVMAVILVVAYVVTQFGGGDSLTFAWLGAAFASAYFGGIIWYRWRR